MLFAKIGFATSNSDITGIPKDQLKLRTQMHLYFVRQSYLTEELLHLYFRLWAAIGLYGPPTIKGYFVRKASN